MNNHLLQLSLTVKEYQALLPRWSPVMEPAPEYSERMPIYAVAKCPFCGSIYHARLDTYSLTNWNGGSADGTCIFNPKYQDKGCHHFIAVDYWINFDGNPKPKKFKVSRNVEVPFVLPPLLIARGLQSPQLETVGVMHALPICEIVADCFEPRYSLYVITYYGYNASSKRKILLELRNGAGELMFLYDLILMGDDSWQALDSWVERDSLWWLDPTKKELSLVHGKVEEFPYRNIQGRRKPY